MGFTRFCEQENCNPTPSERSHSLTELFEVLGMSRKVSRPSFGLVQLD